jgi:WD40 repeat protein
MSIHDSLNNFMQIKIIKIDEPTPYADLSLTCEEDYFGTIGPEANCVLIWNAKTFGLKNRIPISNYSVRKVCMINKNIVAVILENCNVLFFSLASFEGVLLKEFPNIHLNSINDFLVTKNYKFLISAGEEGVIKIWDSKMMFKNHISYQQFIGHSSGIRNLICMEQKSLLITVSETGGLNFWNFLGDLTFCETEITQEMEKCGNLKEVNMLLKSGFNKSQSAKSVLPMSTSSSKMKASHLEKTYKLEHNPNYKEELSSSTFKKALITSTKEADLLKMQVLSMLPVSPEEGEIADINNFSQSNSQFLNSDAFNKNFEAVVNLEEKLLFTPKYLPAKLDKM